MKRIARWLLLVWGVVTFGAWCYLLGRGYGG